MATAAEITWAAGLFEGEGTITVSDTVTARVRNTDAWVIELAHGDSTVRTN